MSDPTQQATEVLNNMMQAGQAAFSQFMKSMGGQVPAMPDAAALGSLPPEAEKVVKLQQDFAARHTALWQAMLSRKPDEPAAPVVPGVEKDRRFSSPEWAESPYFDYLRQSYLLNAQFMQQMADMVPIADGRAKSRMQFMTRQYLDAMAPSNFAATNPEFIKTALETKGESITNGIRNLIADLEKGRISMTDENAFAVGENLAISAGAVVYENPLIQLIQYSPLTEKVGKTPLLIVPPCINKFYILDLQPANSFVRYMVEQGHTVFLTSWKNPGADEARLGWDEYLALGPIAALDVVRDITGVEKPNALGFCVGGTILTSALAVLKARGQDPVASLTLLTTLLDFSDSGEIGCLIDETAVATREAIIGKQGLLPGRELAQVFSSLRANDLIWQYVVGNYLKGRTPDAFDLLYWNADSTNLPGPFLAYYLRHMYLQNDLRVPGRLSMLDTKVDLTRVDVPTYFLSAREDHIVPWQTSYLGRKLIGGETTFVLAASGHIAGVINPASKNRRSYWVNEANVTTADEWVGGAAEQAGSWWPHYDQWLKKFSGETLAARGRLGNKRYVPIEPAPGRYVKERV